MKNIRSEEEFSRIWNESGALVCDFSAAWCGPCKMLEPVLRRLEKENPDITFVKVDVDELSDLSDEHKIQAMPTLLFVRRGREIKRIVGLQDHATLSKHVKRLKADAKGQ